MFWGWYATLDAVGELRVLCDTMPTIIRIGRPSLLSPGRPFDWKRYPVVPKDMVHLLAHVPDAISLKSILQGLDHPDCTVSHIVIPELGRTFRPDGIRMLQEVGRQSTSQPLVTHSLCLCSSYLPLPYLVHELGYANTSFHIEPCESSRFRP